jgi:hypothetical protein
MEPGTPKKYPSKVSGVSGVAVAGVSLGSTSG